MENSDNAVEIFKALGDSTRFKILVLLSTKSNNLCVTAIAEMLNISQPVISQHLKILKNADVVNANRMGNHIHYSINTSTMNSVYEQINKFIHYTSDNHSSAVCLNK